MKHLVVFALLIGFISIVNVGANSGPIYPRIANVDIQGAKYVSAGAYFYFSVENQSNETRDLGIQWYEVFDFEESYIYKISNPPSVVMKKTSFILAPFETKFFHFHAPEIEYVDGYGDYRFYFWEGTYKNPQATHSFKTIVTNTKILSDKHTIGKTTPYDFDFNIFGIPIRIDFFSFLGGASVCLISLFFLKWRSSKLNRQEKEQ